ncbi:MAG TPA: hypothetical protein VGX23_33715 [Actinocrinis sp.]|nr:hypothetical protein [Actinocrinis sp.]
MTTTPGASALDQALESAADLCARHIVGVNSDGPVTGSNAMLTPAEILDRRTALLANVDKARVRGIAFPATVFLLTPAGEVVEVPADRLSSAELVAAQVVIVSCTQVLLRYLAAQSMRLAALERLRVMAEELDALAPGKDEDEAR